MTTTNRKEASSPYYPPRARWYSPAVQCWFEFRRALHLEKIHLPGGLSPRDFLLALVVPGHAFSAFGMRLAGRAILLAFVLELLVFLAALGYAPGNLAFGLMIGAHVTSIIYLAGRLSGATRLPVRLLFAMVTLVVLAQLVYLPLRGLLEKQFVPLRIGGHVIVVKRMSAPKRIQRGDVVAYQFSGHSGDHVAIAAGVGFNPVLAVGGDVVRFRPDGFEVNGVVQPRLPGMPVAGELVVPEKHWFIWPRFAITGERVPGVNVPGLLLQMATVSETQYLGQPYRRWFGRRQNLSPTP